MKRILMILWVFATLLVLLVQPARAQGLIEAENMQIDIWPEYDRSEALVMYRIQLSAQSSLPAQVVVRIPREAISPFNVAYRDVDNKLYNMQYNSTVEGDWIRITATSPSQDIQIEYYDPRLARTNNKRIFEYRWLGDLKVKNMVFRVQNPVNATDMQVNPQKGVVAVDGSFTYNTITVGAVDAGTGFTFQISYNKPDDTLSAASLPVKPAEPITSNPSGSSSLGGENNAIIIGFAAGVVLIAIGLFWYFRTTRRETAPAGKRRHSREHARRSQPVDPGASFYCHQCGKRSNPGDVFCRACGSRLRHE